MKIRSIQVRNFRSVEKADLSGCGGLNILIGKNNAGKSNLLGSIELVLKHLKKGVLAHRWATKRALDQFTDRDPNKVIRIAVEFDLPHHLNDELRDRLKKEAPHLERSIEQLKSENSITFVVAGASDDSGAFIFVERVGVGALAPAADEPRISGITLLSVTRGVAKELANRQRSVSQLKSNSKKLDEMAEQRRQIQLLFDRRERAVRYPFDTDFVSELTRDVSQQVESIFATSANPEGMAAALKQLASELRFKAESMEKEETTEVMSAFAGETRTVPAYATWLTGQYGNLDLLHLTEEKEPIGRNEAATLLDLKLQRGGMERLQTLQQTVKALLGVSVDAFQSRDDRSAEMDVDEFLVEANGAGIREALRMILDLELKEPQLLLVEEPEVHLHPGLSRVIADYLRSKSNDVQMFVTTHSTEFVDSASFQNAYLISRDAEHKTTCQLVDEMAAPTLLPAELGLRLSTVFMFDRLVFVEGPSDEAVLREFAKKIGVDFTRTNLGFVQMGGVRNFAHYAAEATLDLLSRRRISMWFLADRDERGDDEVQRMLQRLGGRATLRVFARREMENYLLSPRAIRELIVQKRKDGGKPLESAPTEQEIKEMLAAETQTLKPEVTRLRLERELLTPIFLSVRTVTGDITARLEWGIRELNERLSGLQKETESASAAVDAAWADRSQELAPGAAILDKVLSKFGLRYSKEKGDGERLAGLMTKDEIPEELRALLSELTAA